VLAGVNYSTALAVREAKMSSPRVIKARQRGR
jgi:hypothetical protein